MRVGRWLVSATLVSLMAVVGSAQSSSLSVAEEQAVTVCLSLIRECQLPDGAFAQASPIGKTHAPVWVAPYFANYAALALLAGYDHKKCPEDLARVGRWLAWCADNQTAEGFWTDHTGTLEAYKSNGTVDAWDSSAALFLLVAGRYHRVGGRLPATATRAVSRALACIGRVTDTDGLTWSKPNYKVKYLMDNVEVCSGLLAAADVFSAHERQAASEQADRIEKKLPAYWRPAEHCYAYALLENHTFSGGLDKPYPHGLAQLFGLAFIASKPALWTNLVTVFQPGTGHVTSTGPEWWLVAASRINVGQTRLWREMVSKEAASFSTQRVYLHRPALSVLALTEGAEWMSLRKLETENEKK